MAKLKRRALGYLQKVPTVDRYLRGNYLVPYPCRKRMRGVFSGIASGVIAKELEVSQRHGALARLPDAGWRLGTLGRAAICQMTTTLL
jgi:hypothetical protein